MINIRFADGTLIIDGPEDGINQIHHYVRRDDRVGAFRARALDYAPIVLELRRLGIEYVDNAKSFSPLELSLSAEFAPRPHQAAALRDWFANGGRGVVALPTGSGKSYLAMMAAAKIKRPMLVTAPTIDLMQQWASQLERFFGLEVGMLGGGSREVRGITVSTYDSAVLNMEFIGDRFGLAVFDECHHLPGQVNRQAALMCIAPYRLGLSATPERDDDGHKLLDDLIGPIVHRVEIDELEGSYLAPYKTRRIEVSLDADELARYQRERKVYTDFLRSNRINFQQRSDWGRFIGLCARSEYGRKVFASYLNQKRIARSGRAKVAMVWELIRRHAGERIIIFTADNETAYLFGRRFFLPVITHRTKAAERKEFLDRFRSGEYPVLVTSKVLNEGVDVPEASVGIVVSGSGSVREHVQRLGRILRAGEGKKAVLYEIISGGTAETKVSDRRREHRAYKKTQPRR